MKYLIPVFLILILIYGCAQQEEIVPETTEEVGGEVKVTIEEPPAVVEEPDVPEEPVDEEPPDVPEEPADEVTSASPEWQTFTLEEVAEHDKWNDCWIVYEGKVFDFTDTPMHPNMAKTFYQYCGQASGFEEAAKARHSSSSQDRVKNYGTLLGGVE